MDEEQMKQKEQEELKALLDAPDDEKSSGDEAKENEDPDKKEHEDDSDPDKKEKTMNDKNKSKDKKKDTKDKDRWHGKSREEIIKEYESLEKNEKPDESTGDEGKENQDESEDLNLPSADELQKMTPSDFAKWVMTRIDEGVKRTIEVQEKVRAAVQKEIEEAKKDHPLHEPDYRKMVQTIIDAASAKGTTVSLKEACMQVDAFLGKHKGKEESEENNEGESEELSDQEKSRLKKAKAQVESGAGAPTQPDSSDAETKRIQKALAGSGSKSPLGGLGI